MGLSVPLHASGLGKVLLAYGAAKLPKAASSQRCTDKTITSEAALRAELGAVRARGYAVTDEELERGLIAFAAPVFRYDGTVVAALSVSAPTSRMTREAAANAARRCVDEAAACRPRSATGPGLEEGEPGAWRTGRDSMTRDELLSELYDKTLTGNGPAVLDLTRIRAWARALARRPCSTRR